MKNITYKVFTHKVDAMKALQQKAARGGYSRYRAGFIELKKLETMIYKFEDRYKINATKQVRYRAKKRGEANTDVVFLKDKETIHFWILVSPGTGPVVDLENLTELTNKKRRLEITGYELVRIQKQSKTSWTWRMTKENHEDFQQRIKNACRYKNADHIRQIQYSLERMPAFSEMRLQAFALHKLLVNEYKKSHKEEYDFKLFKAFYGRFKVAESLCAIKLSRNSRKVINVKEKSLSVNIEMIDDLINDIRELESKLSAFDSRELFCEIDSIEKDFIRSKISELQDEITVLS